MQPWSHLIVRAGKDIENRGYVCRRPGPFLIHTGLRCDGAGWSVAEAIYDALPNRGELPAFPVRDDLDYGGIVGIAEITGVVTHSSSPWFCGPCGWVLERVAPLPFAPLKGRQNFWNVETRDLPEATYSAIVEWFAALHRERPETRKLYYC
jgi:hypothetical protein